MRRGFETERTGHNGYHNESGFAHVRQHPPFFRRHIRDSGVNNIGKIIIKKKSVFFFHFFNGIFYHILIRSVWWTF